MANAVTDWGRSQWMAMLMGLVTVPEFYYVALATQQPGTGIDGTMLADLEPGDPDGYARQPVATGDASWALNGAGYVVNATPVVFGEPVVNWGFVSYFALCDAATAGNLYAYGQFHSPQAITNAYYIQLPAGAIKLKGVSVAASIVT